MAEQRTTSKHNIRLEAILSEYLAQESKPGSKAEKLANAMIKTIEAGYWRPGDRIPTEAAMAETLPVSLGTIQNAMRKLADDGVIERRRGTGSRIADMDEQYKIWFLRFMDDDGQKNLELDILDLSVAETDDQGPWSNFLDPVSGFIRMNRLFIAPGEFKVLGRLYLSAGRFRPLLDYDPATFGRLHVRHVLQHRFNAPTLNVTQNLRLIPLNGEIATVIDLAPGAIGLEMEVYCRTFRNEPLFYQHFFIPPSRRWINIWRPET